MDDNKHKSTNYYYEKEQDGANTQDSAAPKYN